MSYILFLIKTLRNYFKIVNNLIELSANSNLNCKDQVQFWMFEFELTNLIIFSFVHIHYGISASDRETFHCKFVNTIGCECDF